MDDPTPDTNSLATASTSRVVVLVMLKAPRPGLVKTRLAETIGPLPAARIYRRLAEGQLVQLPPAWPVEIHFAPADAATEMRAWLGPQRSYFPQASGVLGPRLIHAVQTAFERGATGVLVIGADCPDLDTPLLETAATALAASRVVLGPAHDGGYYLIGLSAPCPELFTNIPWSTSEVLATTLARVATQGWQATLLPRLGDVDTLDDLLQHPELLTAMADLAPTPTL